MGWSNASSCKKGCHTNPHSAASLPLMRVLSISRKRYHQQTNYECETPSHISQKVYDVSYYGQQKGIYRSPCVEKNKGKVQFINILLFKESVTMRNQLRNNTTGYKL